MRTAAGIAIGCVVLVLSAVRPAGATLMELSVTYSGLESTGPVSLGLNGDDVAPLPTTADITFVLEGVGTSPSVFDLSHVVSAFFVFGELDLDQTNLSSFGFDTGLPAAAPTLFYDFNPVDTLSSTNIIILNSSFQLSVIGTDRDSGLGFEYFYPVAEFTFVAVPEPTSLAIFGFGLLGLGLARRRRKTT